MEGHRPIDNNVAGLVIDIFEEEDRVRLIAELPHVAEEDIRLDLNRDKLFLFAGRYREEIKLPRAVEEITGKTFNNGILEVFLC